MKEFVDDLKIRIKTALKNKDEVTKNLFRIVLGEIESLSLKSSNVTEEQCHNIVRKFIEANNSNIELIKDKPDRAGSVLLANQENFVLQTLLPNTLSVAEIVAMLEELRDGIASAKSVGQANGIAMKFLKPLLAQKGLKAVNTDITAAVESFRTPVGVE